jgi:hypothetical protein
MGNDGKGGAGRPPTSHDILKPFHSSIAQWRAEGLVYRDIADRLVASAGLDVDFNDIRRYCIAENLQPEPPRKLPPTRKDMAGKGRKRQPEAVNDTDEGEEASGQAAALAAGDEPADNEPSAEDEPAPGQGKRPPRGGASKAASDKKANLAARAREIAAGLFEEPTKPTADRGDVPSPDEPADDTATDGAQDEPPPAATDTDDADDDADDDTDVDESAAPDDAEIQREQAARTNPEKDSREQDVTPFVHQGLGANKTEREQAPQSAPTDAVGMPGWESMDAMLARRMSALTSLLDSPQEFRAIVAQLTADLEAYVQTLPPAQQGFFRDRVAWFRTWTDANTPERLKDRSPQQEAADELSWKAQAARIKSAAAGAQAPAVQSVQPASKPSPPQNLPGQFQPRHPPPISSATTHSHRPLFVPLPRHPVWTPDLELLTFNGGADRFTLADACEGVAIFGSTGSGKTSGSGQALARSYLGAGFGGLVLTAKVDECELWQRYAELTGRTQQLCIVRPGGPFAFNFLDYQARLPEEQGGSTVNAVELLFAILSAYARSHAKSSADMYWENTAREMLTNILRVFRAADEMLTLDKLRQFMSEAPHNRKEVKSGAFKDGKLFAPLLARASRLSRGTPSAVSIDEAERFWMTDFPRLDERPRSIVESHLTSMINMFFEPQVWNLFCGETTLTPDAVFDGAVIVVDLPVERNLSIGRIAAIIFKHFFQLAVPRRTDPKGPTQRPVFLWADEAQNFTTEHDSIFQATARSARAATVYLTQNISNFYAQANGDHHRVDGFFSNLNTKIFHANNDPTTNHWAAEMIGKSMKYRASVTRQDAPDQGKRNWWQLGKPSNSTTTNSQMDYEIQPADFGKLRTGGIHPDRPEDDLQVDAYLFKSGARFSNGKNFFGTTFLQG